MWFRREPSSLPAVTQGELFRRARGADVETAKIIAITADPAGIPHVRFRVEVEGRRDEMPDERTLALEWFRALYREPVKTAESRL